MKTSAVLHPDAPLWELAFRPLFLLAAILAVVAILVWLGWLDAFWNGAGLRWSPLYWHVHEMLFGFGFTVAAGFLLTAAQSWTGQRSLHGYGLQTLVLLWILLRMLLWSSLPLLVLVVLQSSWWLLVICAMARMLIVARSKRNYLFLPILAVIALLQLAFIVLAEHQSGLALHVARTAILVFCLIIGVVAGRVVPMFTRNAVASERVQSTPVADRVLLLLSALAAICYLLSALYQMPINPGFSMIVIAHIHLYRLGHWGGWYSRNEALLWSLHLAYLALAIGLALTGMALLTGWIAVADALHLLTVGAIGFLIMSMMARVSLGHTGRPLRAHRLIQLALCLLLFAAAVRLLLPILSWPQLGWNLSGLLWATAFLLFLRVYVPILVAPRRGLGHS
ncbi:NnrS family protein [Parathalassolituus penaei]|uniref:NnrS family protein n=1 Tax=Parathalassolituus penaei TaxID=2997323 RepID=A0A9X3IRI9_9GAMM|nr:NnrS family protein [Parathalassolituus penaei]MCY0965272.1 NnrS family protein [Parathalassolituus penaei]